MMKRVYIGSVLACVALSTVVMGIRADGASKEKDLQARLVGTWREVSMKVSGRQIDMSRLGVTYKHVTPAAFMWLSYHPDTGKVYRAAGGTYTLRGDTYTEKIEYGMGGDFDVIKNAEHTFTAKVDGDRWYHTGALANGMTIDEVWERVTPSGQGSAVHGSPTSSVSDARFR